MMREKRRQIHIPDEGKEMQKMKYLCGTYETMRNNNKNLSVDINFSVRSAYRATILSREIEKTFMFVFIVVTLRSLFWLAGCVYAFAVLLSHRRGMWEARRKSITGFS